LPPMVFAVGGIFFIWPYRRHFEILQTENKDIISMDGLCINDFHHSSRWGEVLNRLGVFIPIAIWILMFYTNNIFFTTAKIQLFRDWEKIFFGRKKTFRIFAVSFRVSESTLETWRFLIMNEIKNKINKK